MITNFEALLAAAKEIEGKSVLVVYPNNDETFGAIRDAIHHGLARFILVGSKPLMEQALDADVLGRCEIHDAADPVAALGTAIGLVAGGKADILMKGGIDTSSMMKAVLKAGSGIRTGRLLSDIFLLEFPERPDNKFIMITDGGMTMSPDLKNKVDLIRNAVEVAHALGNENPRVAVLSATEFIVPSLQSTLDAAALSKINDRGQIKGCTVDGPFALDNAISVEAAEEKGIKSPVAGRAEILVAANIESANSLAKSTTYFAGLRLAHVIVGGRVPVLIPSRSDKSDAKLLSIALGVIMSSRIDAAD